MYGLLTPKKVLAGLWVGDRDVNNEADLLP